MSPTVTVQVSYKVGDPGRPEGPGYVRYEDLYVTGDNLQDVIDKVPADAAGAPQVLTFPAGEFIIPPDFSGLGGGGVSLGHRDAAPNCRGLAGSGKHDTVLTCESANVPTWNDKPTGSVPPYYLILAFQTTDAGTLQRPEFRNFHLKGQPLNGDMWYHGLRTDNVADGTVDNLLVSGIVGGMNQPPGETYAMGFYRTTNLDVTNCEVDGRNVDTGEPTSATMIGAARSHGVNITDSWCHDNKVGMAVVYWFGFDSQVTRLRMENIAIPTEKGYCANHEQSDRITYTDCVWHHGQQSGNFHLSVESHGIYADAPVDPMIRVENPDWDALTVGDGQFVAETWSLDGQQLASKPPQVVDAAGGPIPFYWANPFGERWINQ